MRFSSASIRAVILILMIAPSMVYAGDKKSAAIDKQKAEAAACQIRMNDFITPNARHDLLRSFEGKWNAVIKVRPTPTNAFSRSEASVDAHMIMDGRYLERVFLGKGDNFQARLIHGYDNFRKEYTSTWFDNMCTGMITGSGQYDADTNTFMEEGNMSCPMTDQARRWFKSTTKIIDQDHHIFEMSKRDEDGEEFIAMTIDYSRVP